MTQQPALLQGGLLPCPFCGGEAEITGLFQSKYYQVSCKNRCSVRPITNSSDIIESPEAAWNTRTPTVESGIARERVEAVVERLIELRKPRVFCSENAVVDIAIAIVREELSIPQEDRESMPAVRSEEDFESWHKRLLGREPVTVLGEDGFECYFGESSIAYKAWFDMSRCIALAQADKTAGLADRVRALEVALRGMLVVYESTKHKLDEHCNAAYVLRARQALGDAHE